MHGRGLTSLLGGTTTATGGEVTNRRMTSTLGTDDGDTFSQHYPPHNNQ